MTVSREQTKIIFFSSHAKCSTFSRKGTTTNPKVNATGHLYSEYIYIYIQITVKKHEAIPYILALKPWRSIKPKPSSIYIWQVSVAKPSRSGQGRDPWRWEATNIPASLNEIPRSCWAPSFFCPLFSHVVDPSCQEGPRNEVLQHLKPAVIPGIKMPLNATPLLKLWSFFLVLHP